jgi:uncharacterized membrane protein
MWKSSLLSLLRMRSELFAPATNLLRRTSGVSAMTGQSVAAEVVGAGAEMPVKAPHRVESIDLVRGAVMILMVLDHVRDFFGEGTRNPTDLATTTPALYFTRWVTHFCAPSFMLLAGFSAALWGARRSRGELSRHLLTRGLWLIFLEQTWVCVFLFFTYPQFVLALVLWAIGWSMIALAALVYLPRVAIATLGVAMIACHNLFDGFEPSGSLSSVLWGILHSPGMRVLPGGIPILVLYPLIPWIGVMAIGYALGPLFLKTAQRRVPILFAMGLGTLAGFIVLRWINIYGDPRPWEAQKDLMYSVMSFLNCQKYPPSLLFLLMTLGGTFLALAAFDRGLPWLGGPLRVFGQVPLFFFLLHLPLAHGLALVFAASQGYPIRWMFQFPPFQSPPGYGTSLLTVYVFWAVAVALLYYPCLWYAGRKRRRRAGG